MHWLTSLNLRIGRKIRDCASDTHWVGIATQVPYKHLYKKHKDQRHSPLTFRSVQFNATQSGWVNMEKERNYAHSGANALARSHICRI